MDDNVLDEKKNSFLKLINDALDTAHSSNTISEIEMQKCASFILDEMGLMKSDEDMLELITRVNTEWKIFDSVITLLGQKEHIKEHIQEDQEAIDKVKDVLASLSAQA